MEESFVGEGAFEGLKNNDAWECPIDGRYPDSQTDVAVGVSKYGNSSSDRMRNSEAYDIHKKIGSIKCDAKKETLSSNSRDMVHETQIPTVEEHKLDSCTNTDRPISLQKGLLSTEIDLAPNSISVQGTKSSHSLILDLLTWF